MPSAKPDFTQMDGVITVEVIAYQHGDERHWTRDESNQVLTQNPGYTLRELRAKFGGLDYGHMIDPFKQQSHVVDLRGLTLGDPDTTRILVKFHFRTRR